MRNPRRYRSEGGRIHRFRWPASNGIGGRFHRNTHASGRVEKTIEIYRQLQKRFKVFLETENGEYLVERFREEYPAINITRVKMADLVLWQSR